MLDPQTRKQVQNNFQHLKPQLKQRFAGITDADLDMAWNDPDLLVSTISEKTGTPEGRVASEIQTLVESAYGTTTRS